MPIKAEKKALYPANWPALSVDARKRAGHRCQWEGCGARNYSVGAWKRENDGLFRWCPVWGDDDNPRTYTEARQVAADADWEREHLGEKPLIVIVLTVAHLDHDPSNCDPSNLRVWCQRHHLAYDQEHHRRNAFHTRRAASRTADLFA